MKDNPIVPLDTQQLRIKLTHELSDTSFTEKLSKQTSHARRITLLASRAKNEFESDPLTTLSVAQEVLLEKKLITAATHAPFQPLPKKIRRPGTAAELALHTSLRDVLHQNIYLLRDSSDPETLGRGFLILAIVLEGGVLSRRELQGFLTTAAEQGLRVMGELRYVNAPSQLEGGKTLDNRRVHLSPLMRALLLRQTPESLRQLAADPDSALTHLGNASGIPKLRLAAAQRAMASYSEHILMLPLWLLSWMRHDAIYSSSLVENCWLRLNGYAGDARSAPAAPSHMERQQEVGELDSSDEEDGGSQTPKEAGSSFDLTLPDANDPVFSHIGRILRQNGASPVKTKTLIAELSSSFNRIGRNFPAAPQLYEWLISLHDQFKACSTIRLNFFAIAHRLLAYCGDTGLDELTQEDLDLIREQLLEDGLSASTISNVAGALNHLTRFLGQQGINTTLKPITTGNAVAQANARILLPKDIQETLEFLLSARCRLAPNCRRAAQNLVTLCFHTGLRRQEALHLNWQQVRGSPADICVRNTVSNRLKTISSRRNIPYQLLDLHQGSIHHQIRRSDCSLIVKPDVSMSNEEMEPGSDYHRNFGESLAREIHRTFRTLTGDDHITLHSLRHSCATTLLLLLMARRFRLHELTSAIPFLGDILTPEAEQLVRQLICPNSYQNDGELAAVRDVLGHSSESMTLAHYVHALDILRFAALRGEWLDDASTIGSAAGLSDYLCRQHPLDKLLLKLESRSPLQVTVFLADESPRYTEVGDGASQLIRQMTVASMKIRDEAQINSFLIKAGHPGLSAEGIQALKDRKRHIEPLAINFLSNKSSATSIRNIMPDYRWRDEAIWFCENILRKESQMPEIEALKLRLSLSISIHDFLLNTVQIGSSVIRIPDLSKLKSVDIVCASLLGDISKNQRYFTWKKSAKSHRRKFVSRQWVEAELGRNSKSQTTIFLKLDIHNPFSSMNTDEDKTIRNPLSVFAWTMAAYFILSGPS